MIVTLLGATGGTGQRLLDQAIAAGHEVHSLVRRPASIAERPNLTLLVGDATNSGDVAKVSQGSDVVISALGAGLGKSTLMVDAVRAIVEASEMTNVKRVVLMSGFVVGAADHLALSGKLIANTLLRNVRADKCASEVLLTSSDLVWTIASPAVLTNKDEIKYRIVAPTEKVGVGHTISRASAAAWMLDVAVNNRHIRENVVISA